MFKKALLTFFLFSVLFNGSACSEEPQTEESSFAGLPGGKQAQMADHLTSIPAMVNMVFYMDLHALRETSVGAEMREEIAMKITDDEDYLEFMEQTGVDIRRDLDQVWVGALNGRGRSLGGAIATGNFDAKKIVTYLENRDHDTFEQRSYRGYDVYSGHDKDNSVVFINSSTAVIGDTEWVNATIDQIEDKAESVLDNPEIAGHVDDVRTKSPLWGAFDLRETSGKWAEEIKKRGSSFKGTKSLENIQSLVFHTEVQDKADIFIKGNFTTEEEAQLLAEMMNGFKAMAKLMVSDDREAVDMINEIKIESAGAVLEVSATMDKQFIDKVKEKQKVFSNSPVRLM